MNKEQRVLCIESGYTIDKKHFVKKGNNYTISVPPYLYKGHMCVKLEEQPYINWCADRFAPITEQYADITAEIAAGADRTDEKPDIVKQPITIENEKL